jgi:hypothetical protein
VRLVVFEYAEAGCSGLGMLLLLRVLLGAPTLHAQHQAAASVLLLL